MSQHTCFLNAVKNSLCISIKHFLPVWISKNIDNICDQNHCILKISFMQKTFTDGSHYLCWHINQSWLSSDRVEVWD